MKPLLVIAFAIIASAGRAEDSDSTKFRLMQQTTSLDGRFAFAWAPSKDGVDLETYSSKALFPDEIDSYLDDDNDQSRNYIVDLHADHILGTTGCHYPGTRINYNHRERAVAWSADSTAFLQTTRWKWCTDAFRAGLIKNGRLVGTVDLLNPATKRAYAYLAVHKNAAFSKYVHEIALTIDSIEVNNEGVIQCNVSGEVPKSDAPNSSFSVIERFQLKQTAKGLRLINLDIRYAPKN